MNTTQPFLIARRDDVQKRVDELSKKSDDIKSRFAKTLKRLWQPERRLAAFNDLSVFKDLKQRFPNFLEIVDFIESNAIGLSKFDLPFEITPILLLGEPGLGKTYFVSELAKLMNITYYEISMATMTASFALTGGNIQWGEGTIGFIANSLIDSEVANPIFLIDEIDKSHGSYHYNPINAFYSLLEPHSAKNFLDEALEIKLDASRVIWFATANNLNEVPEPIQSRFTVIQIRQPDRAQMKHVIASIYSNFRSAKPFGSYFNASMLDETIEVLLDKSPREARIAIDAGCLTALKHDRKDVLPCDFPKLKKEKRHVGF